MSHVDTVIANGVVIHASALKNFLKKSHYYLSYDVEKKQARFGGNHDNGGKTLITFERIGHESVEKLAHLLGMKESGHMSWSKFNSVVELLHNNTEEADRVLLALVKLDVAYVVKYRDNEEFSISVNSSRYLSSLYSVEKMVEIIENLAEKSTVVEA